MPMPFFYGRADNRNTSVYFYSILIVEQKCMFVNRFLKVVRKFVGLHKSTVYILLIMTVDAVCVLLCGSFI